LVQASVPVHRLRADRRAIPEATVARLPLYLRVLIDLADTGRTTISSEDLATAAGVTSAKVRKDLSQLGSYGTRGVGYEVDCLCEEISRELGVTQHRAVAIVGVGNLGHALAGYGGFSARGFRIAGLFDADPDRFGELVAGMRVRPMEELEQVVASERVSIAVIATPAAAAQQVCDRLVASGVTSVLNFASTVLAVPANVDVRKVDLAVELQILSFHETRKSRAASTAPPPAAACDLDEVDEARVLLAGIGVTAVTAGTAGRAVS
jgi:redox-sensing transcriptional repressor